MRLLNYLNQVGDADLRIARDLMSHRIYREEFWQAAAALDRTAAFPSDAVFENAGVDHRYFAQIGLRQIVSIVDTSFGAGANARRTGESVNTQVTGPGSD